MSAAGKAKRRRRLRARRRWIGPDDVNVHAHASCKAKVNGQEGGGVSVTYLQPTEEESSQVVLTIGLAGKPSPLRRHLRL
jgi:hypothetical protein